VVHGEVAHQGGNASRSCKDGTHSGMGGLYLLTRASLRSRFDCIVHKLLLIFTKTTCIDESYLIPFMPSNVWCVVCAHCFCLCTLGVEPWSTSGGQVPLVLQTCLRVGFVVQGLVCVGLLVTSKLFALYAVVAFIGLGAMAQIDPPEW